jgi:hypothetical protein
MSAPTAGRSDAAISILRQDSAKRTAKKVMKG